MIVGVGVDIEEIPRIKKAYKQINFLRQLNLTGKYSNASTSSFPSDYCIIEALFKALGCPIGFSTKNISIIRVDGQPHVEILDFSLNGLYNFKIHVSVSYAKNLVACVVIVES